MSGIVEMAYNPFINKDMRDCYFDYEQAVYTKKLGLRLLRKSVIRSSASQQVKLGLVMEDNVTAPSIPKSDNSVGFKLGFSDELLRTNFMGVRELMKPS